MSVAAVRILVFGSSIPSTQSLLRRLARFGLDSHPVESLREADPVLRTIRFQLILAIEKLPDGTGYELASLVARQSSDLFISILLSESCLCLPAVERGVKSPGRARVVSDAARERGGGDFTGVGGGNRSAEHRSKSPRRETRHLIRVC